MTLGRIIQVTSTYAGTSTTIDHSVGDTAITVDSLRFFPLDQGLVKVGENAVTPYSAVDRENKVLTIDVSLDVAAPAGSHVLQFPFGVQRWALIQPDTSDEVPLDSIWAIIPAALAAFVADDGLRAEEDRELVEYSQDSISFVVQDILSKKVFLNPLAIPDGSVTVVKLDPIFVEKVDLNEAGLTELNDVTLPALNSRLDAAELDVDNAMAAVKERARVIFQTTQPTGLTADDRVVWYDTDDGYAASYWNGSAWAPYSMGPGAIAANAIIAGKIAANAVTATTIAADAVIAVKIAANAVIAGKIAADAVTATTVAANAVTAGTIAANAVTSNTVAANAIIAGKINTDAVTSGTIAANAVTAGKLAANAVTAGTIAANAVTAGTIAANAVTAVTIAADALIGKVFKTAVTGERMEISTPGESLITFFSGNANETAPGYIRADVDTVSNRPIVKISAQTVTSAPRGASITLGTSRIATRHGVYAVSREVVLEAENTTGSTQNGIYVLPTDNDTTIKGGIVLAADGASDSKVRTYSGGDTEIWTAQSGGTGRLMHNDAEVSMIGEVRIWAGTVAAIPAGWLLCNGQLRNRTTDAKLFAKISTAFNIGGEASTDFRLPDLRGKVVAGQDTADGNFNVIGESGGVDSVTLTAAQSGIPQHYHTYPAAPSAGFADTNDGPLRASGVKDNNFKTGGVSTSSVYGGGSLGAQNASQAHTNLQPYQVLNYIIRYR